MSVGERLKAAVVGCGGAPTPADCRRMLEAAAASGRMLGIALDKRFSEEFRLARKLIRDGEIGEPLFVRIHWVATVEWSGFRTKRYTGGAVFQDVGSHFLDLIPWTLDTELRSVHCSGGAPGIRWKRAGAFDVEIRYDASSDADLAWRAYMRRRQ